MIRREVRVRRIGARPRVAKSILEWEITAAADATLRDLEETVAVALAMRGVIITGATGELSSVGK